jgi:hypothetical protein
VFLLGFALNGIVSPGCDDYRKVDFRVPENLEKIKIGLGRMLGFTKRLAAKSHGPRARNIWSGTPPAGASGVPRPWKGRIRGDRRTVDAEWLGLRPTP